VGYIYIHGRSAWTCGDDVMPAYDTHKRLERVLNQTQTSLSGARHELSESRTDALNWKARAEGLEAQLSLANDEIINLKTKLRIKL
jgi:hypothetical protein